MKPIVKKILESGLVDKHTAALMEKWGTLEPGATDLVGKEDLMKASSDTLMKFADDIEGLIETERTRITESRLSMLLESPFLAFVDYGNSVETVALFKDDMEHYFFPPSSLVSIGMKFKLTDDTEYEIVDIVAIHSGEETGVLQASVRNITPRAG